LDTLPWQTLMLSCMGPLAVMSEWSLNCSVPELVDLPDPSGAYLWRFLSWSTTILSFIQRNAVDIPLPSNPLSLRRLALCLERFLLQPHSLIKQVPKLCLQVVKGLYAFSSLCIAFSLSLPFV